MRWAGKGAVLLVSLLVFVAGNERPAIAESCNLTKFASFEITPQRDARVTIPVQINGTPGIFLVDTGGVYSEISSNAADASQLARRSITSGLELYAAGGQQLKQYVRVDTLEFGGLRAHGVSLVVKPSTTGRADLFQGTLAPDFLTNFDLDFDFAGKTLNLFSPDHCKGRVVYWTTRFGTIPFSQTVADHHIRVQVTLDGHELTAIVDTGASFTLLRANAARMNFGLGADSHDMEPIPGATPNGFIQYRHRFTSLSVGDVVVTNPLIAILPDAEEATFWRNHTNKVDHDPFYGPNFHPEPLILGMDVLHQLHLYVAYGERTLYVTAADGDNAESRKGDTTPSGASR